AGGNAVAGQAASLTAETVKVPNTAAGSAWQDHGDGTYSAAYTAQTAGTGLTASLQLSGWGGSVGSPAYVITAG
ncbi:hypothetical protein L0N33_24920, partial [Roseburia faecis]|nr:hypothetical protein [Roseburia faecis]